MAHNDEFYLGQCSRIIDIDKMVRVTADNKSWVNAVNGEGETPLHIAARKKKYKLFQTMLPYFNDIGLCDNQGNTILHALVDVNADSHDEHKEKSINVLRALIARGADTNRKNKNGQSAVHLAVKHCSTQVLDVLKAGGANFYLRTNDGETPLFLVCKDVLYSDATFADTKAIDYLMNLGCDLNAKDNEGDSILHHAVNLYNVKNVKQLIKRGADVNSQTKTYKLTPLHLASQKDCPAMLKALIKASANVNAVSTNGLTPLHLAVLLNSSKVIRSLVKYGADVNYTGDFAPLHLAVCKKSDDAFRLLISKGADVNVLGKDDLTPLHLASILGDSKFVKALLEHNATVDCRDKNQYTPLHFAIRSHRSGKQSKSQACFEENSFISKLLTQSHASNSSDYKAIADLLLNSASDVNALTKHGTSPLHLASEAGNVKLVKTLLERKANVNCVEKSSGFTALHTAVINRREDVAEALINAKADVNILTEDGKSPLHFAAEVGLPRLVKTLIKCGADVHCKETSSGFTPLHFCSCNGNKDAARELINAKAEVNALTKVGKSPLHLAVESSKIEISILLLEHGAKLNCTGKRCRYTLLYMIARDGFTTLDNFRAKIDDVNGNFSRTWLHSAMSQLRNKNTVEALLRLTALVDSYDKSGCIPVHRALQCDHLHFKNLEMFGADLDDVELYSKSIFWQITSDIGKDTDVLEHLFKLKTLRLPMANGYHYYSKDTESMFNCLPDENPEYYQKFLDEVKKLRNYSIKENVTLYRLLHMRTGHRCSYAKNIKLHEIEAQFPIYHNLIVACYNDAVVREPLIKAAQFALHQLMDFEFPILCIEEICSNLSIINLIALIQSVEIIEPDDK